MIKLLKKLKNSKRGFSLVELIVVIAIMAVIAAVLVPSLLMHVEESRAEKDIKTTDEVVTAVELALADQDVYDELVEHSVFDNVSCYVDKDSESGYEKVVIKETYNGNAEQYKFGDDARQNDEVPYYGAGNMRGLTVTFSPEKDSNESTYELSRGIINRFVGRKTGYLYENEKLYNAIRSVVGDKIYNSSQTYRNSDFTIFIRLGSAGGNEAGNQDATQVWGQYNGTNLPADAVQTAKITTDRAIGDAGQYDAAVNEYINDETNTDIDFSQLAAMGNSNFGSTLESNKTEEPGFYDVDGNLLMSWSDFDSTGKTIIEREIGYSLCWDKYINMGITEEQLLEIGAKKELRNCKKIIIPSTITKINYNAFSGCEGLTNVTIPNSVKEISSMAFQGCTNLTSITIPDSVTKISNYAFSGCTSLTNITLSNSLISINSDLFYNCRSLTNITIPNSVTKIRGNAFQYCTSLTDITIPDSVTSIESYAFSNCTSLTSIDLGNGVEKIGSSVFEKCENLTSVKMSNNLTSIDAGAFSGCKNLTSLVIPSSVTTIKGNAFVDCINLTIQVPTTTTLTSDSFKSCKEVIYY